MEIWKDIKGFEGIYQISNLGNVKRINITKGVNKKYQNGYYLKPLDNGMGYLRIKLSKNGKSKRYMLHRLIAIAFIPNPENKPNVNHKNHSRRDNRIENLEWCTQSENVLHSVKSGRWHATKENRQYYNHK